MGSLEGLSTVAALVITVFLTPWFTGLSADWAVSTFTDIYGYGYGHLLSWSWIFICGAALFFITRGILSLALSLGSSWIALRFFGS